VDEFNGPVVFLPGTHRLGTLVGGPRATSAKSAQHVDPDDYAVGRDELTRLVDKHGMVSAKGPAGSIVLFHPEIVHGSATNISPYPRNLLIITYNDVASAPRRTGPHRRPEHLVGRDTTPLVPTAGPIPSAELVG
jgi:ectoine hydroxylase